MCNSALVRKGSLTVPGASPNYELLRSGPVLQMLPEGPADATAYEPIREYLSDCYTLLTYDRAPSRGADWTLCLGTQKSGASSLTMSSTWWQRSVKKAPSCSNEQMRSRVSAFAATSSRLLHVGGT